MEYLPEFLTVATVHLLAVASPGPDFAVVVRESVGHGRRVGVLTSLGVGTGILVHVAYSLLGIGLIVSQSILAFTLMKYLGAAYLVWLGVRALRARPADAATDSVVARRAAPAAHRAFVTGFLTNGLNPKATLFFLSLFSVVISADTPLALQVAYGGYMAVATAAWFSLLAVAFGHARVRAGFARLGHWFERIMGGVLIALGVSIAAAGARRV
ncbi:LysE family transporter [Arhodomonas aquaeolei]|uniref:LysE family transporter n=1 Tax=Arhodomonas aquaeolei TaxID=2369 RepID=UPI00216A9388|nr:LysE family transporter [Arhodomonas aquaeolei]MCS4505672.1 LysE family transporter [Arhodomonas aquaeolei]